MAKSYTFTMHGLVQALNIGLDTLRAQSKFVNAAPQNKKLSDFIVKNHAALIADYAKVSGNFKTAVSGSKDDISAWLAAGAKRDIKKLANVSDEVHVGSSYVFDNKWAQHSGAKKSDPIKGHRAFTLENAMSNGKGVALLRFDGGSYALVWYATSKTPLDLYAEAIALNTHTSTHRVAATEVSLPVVNEFVDAGDYKLAKWEIGASSLPIDVMYAAFVNTFRMSEAGVRATSKVQVGLRTRGLPPQKLKLVFDKPFAVALFDNGSRFPTFVAQCNKDSWIKA